MVTNFDSAILLTILTILGTLVALAVFDLYAFSPRPSGIAKRSRELAPIFTIAIAIGVALLSLLLSSNFASFTNEAMQTLQSERIRLVTYPLVVTNVFESLMLSFALLTSAYFLVGRLGLLGWSVVTLTIVLLTGAVAVTANPSSTNYGPFELVLGLALASAYAFSRQRGSKRREHLELSLLSALILAAAAAGALTESPVRPELVISAMLIAVATTAGLFYLTRIAGPHWEATSLFFVSGIGAFVLTGFMLALAPHFFDRDQWRSEVISSRAAIQNDLIKTMRPIEFGAGLTPENETNIAKRLASGATRLRYLASRAELSSNLEEGDRRTVHELRSLERMLIMLERLHESRALVSDAERRASASSISSTDPSRVDPMIEFWQHHRPWLTSELMKLKTESGEPNAAFVASMETDLDRLTRAAVEVEIHRVDVWVDWAARQPRESVPSLKQTASAQMARLDELVIVTEPLPLRRDSRFSSLHQNLRKMASVSESKWE